MDKSALPLSSSSVKSEAHLRNALVCTWHAFFARFPHLRDIQKAAIMPILSGESVVVNAPTASGKTEAIMAPVLERYLRNCHEKKRCHATAATPSRTAGAKGHTDNGKGPAILIVAPTKALCNDLCRRLKSPVEMLGLSVTIRTGDNPNFNLDKPPVIIVTTPESLDSMIARKPSAFLYLEAIVLDEIHLVSASGRGDQLMCLLTRLKTLNKNQQIQICASSATVPEIKRITHDFLGEQGRIISSDGEKRSIQASLIDVHSDSKIVIQETADIVEKMLTESTTRKMIVFCNARSTVEALVHAMHERPRIASIVFAHHGSLSKEERLRTEQQFLRARNAACVATSTLELGIDIGDVDRIVLLGPPPDVSSLIQRIGRGNRTQSSVHVVCLADCAFNRQRFLHLVECARKESLFPDPVSFRPTTIVQQALSICLQNPQKWIGKQALYDRLPRIAQKIYQPEDCGLILDQMVSCGNLFRKVDRGRYVPESKTQFLFDRGYMHTMIVDRGETDVVDSVTGRTLGSVYLKKSSKDAIVSGSGVNISLAGNAHTVSYIKDKKIFVKRGEEVTSISFMALEPPRYSLGLAQDFARFMQIQNDALYIKCVPQSMTLERDFTPQMGLLLDKKLAIQPDQIPPGSEWIVFHFLGTIGGTLLQNFFEKSGYSVKKGSKTPFFLRLSVRPNIQSLPQQEILATQFELYVRSNVNTFAKLLQPGPWFNLIPENLALDWLLSSLDIQAYASTLAQKPIVLV